MFNSCHSPPGRDESLWPVYQAFWKILYSIQNSTCVSEFKPEKSALSNSLHIENEKSYHFIVPLIHGSCSRKMWCGVSLLVSHLHPLGFSYGHIYGFMKIFFRYIYGHDCSFTLEISITSGSFLSGISYFCHLLFIFIFISFVLCT